MRKIEWESLTYKLAISYLIDALIDSCDDDLVSYTTALIVK